ncbi:TonB-dependent receptor [Niabella aquatica]
MRLLFLLLSFTTATVITKAQVITGKIADTGSKPLPGASVALLKASDSALVKMNITDKEGLYRFDNIISGNYLLQVTSVGYTKTFSPVFNHSTDSKQNVALEKTGTQMAGVVVTAKKPPVEVKAGKTVVNVDASPSNAGLNVLEILQKSPGVSVDNDDNISLQGKGGVLILIDGKPTYLSGQNLATFLKSLQAGSLDQIEIMTNPPAKYDAAGAAGVINIKTKKGTIRGMNGNMNLNYVQGLYPKYNGGANFNLRNKKVNLFGSYNGGAWESWGIMNINRNFYREAAFSGSSKQTTQRHNKSSWHNGKMGMDYYFTDKDVAGVVVSGNINPWNNWQESASELYNAANNLNNVLRSKAYNGGRAKNITTNLNYKHTFDSAGREVSFDLDQGYYHNRSSNALTTSVYKPDNTQEGKTVMLNGVLPSIINIYSGKADYAHPFNKNTKLETGIKTSFVNTDNNVLYQRDTSTGWYVDEQRTNHFIYRENVNAAYAILTKHIKKWEFTAGLRVENTYTKGIQQQGDSAFKRNYTNLFPNAGIAYSINDKNQLSAAYSRRIRRPDYNDLNPFVYFIDSLTYGQGNPYLQPEFSNRVEVTHTFNRFLSFTVSHTRTNNIITRLLKQNTEKKTAFQTTENLSTRRQWGASVSVNKQIVKWWNLSLYSGVFNNQYKGLYIEDAKNTPIKININVLDANMSSSFSFAKTWTGEISGWYVSNPSEGLIIGRPMGGMNAAISKQVLKKNGTVKLGVRDIFRTQNFSGYSRYADVDINIFNDRRRDSRQFNISFAYKFGKNGAAPARRRTGGAGDEQSRVGSGGN